MEGQLLEYLMKRLKNNYKFCIFISPNWFFL